MLAGTVTDDGVPVIMLLLAGKMSPGIIDTGFNGDLELPESLRWSLKARFLDRTSPFPAVIVNDDAIGILPLRAIVPINAESR